jgi:sialic acid synthase SpsE/RimJ/RimL family protein N-acetyltransferase
MEMPYEWLPVLSDACRERRIEFLVSVFDEDSADRVDPYVKAFKIASYEMTHLPLLRHVAAKGKPVIVSTGTATLDEVAESVDAFFATGNRNLVLMQCTAAYPAALDALNVRAIAALRDRFDVPVGFSDHSRDPIVAPVAAVACGACVLEKHFTPSNALEGPDHRFAVEPAELRSMVQAIRDAEAALGSAVKTVAPVEQELRAFARRSIFARRPIARGEVFTTDNTAVLRCGQHEPGLPPARYETVLGRRATRPVSTDAAICEADVEPGDEPVTLRRAAAGDAGIVWEWANDPVVRRASFHTDPIPWERHVEWFNARLASASSRIYIVAGPDASPAGVVRFERGEDGNAEVGVNLAASHRGRGLGRLALKVACRAVRLEWPGARIVAHIRPENEASVAAFVAAGFEHRGVERVQSCDAFRLELPVEQP